MSRFLNHLLVYLILGVLVLAPLGAILYEALLPDAGTGQGIALLHLGVDRHFLHALLGTLGMAGFAV
ncbi:MAG: hypothetical protein JJ714_04110, partial [Acidithiobacillus sp.]|nr:hypothetical protein [Acidithiobacillus sp.]